MRKESGWREKTATLKRTTLKIKQTYVLTNEREHNCQFPAPNRSCMTYHQTLEATVVKSFI